MLIRKKEEKVKRTMYESVSPEPLLPLSSTKFVFSDQHALEHSIILASAINHDQLLMNLQLRYRSTLISKLAISLSAFCRF
jgi:hypothetical protein